MNVASFGICTGMISINKPECFGELRIVKLGHRRTMAARLKPAFWTAAPIVCGLSRRCFLHGFDGRRVVVVDWGY